MSDAMRDFRLETRPACVLADGPEETDGDGGYEYTVCFGDENGDPIDSDPRAIWRLWDYDEVCRFARELAQKYGLEEVNEAMAV